MAKKRKRPDTLQEKARKRTKLEIEPRSLPANSRQGHVRHPVLSLYYPRVTTLRNFLLSSLPAASKVRHRKIASLGFVREEQPQRRTLVSSVASDTHSHTEALPSLLDKTLIGVAKEHGALVEQERKKDFVVFSQSQYRSSLVSSGKVPDCSQSEIIDFAIYTLFRKAPDGGSYFKPNHLLCHGFQRAKEGISDSDLECRTKMPAIVSRQANEAVATLRSSPWSDVFRLLGESAESVWQHLLLDCGIFIRVEAGLDNFYQLSGVRLDELNPLGNQPRDTKSSTAAARRLKSNLTRNTPNHITLVRSRMFYARPALNARGQVRFGLKHIHVLNRYPDSSNAEHATHIMKYMFPRQFGLHNVFTSLIDKKETVQPFKDYTLREHEITRKKRPGLDKLSNRAASGAVRQAIPKRLRGTLLSLVQRIQRNHATCSYAHLLMHYCSDNASSKMALSSDSVTSTAARSSPGNLITQVSPKLSVDQNSSNATTLPTVQETKAFMIDHSTPPASVSSFCRAVLHRLLPKDLFGSGSAGCRNQDSVMKHVDRFISLRRFETLSLHEVCQGLKITGIQWLTPPTSRATDRLAQTDSSKRLEIFMEFLYYLFDSLLIPLIRSNFYVTESNVHKYRLFYFRHDIWKRISEPYLTSLRLSMFEEVKPDRVRKLFRSRTLGFSQLRLCPKVSGVRPLMNLKRRAMRRENGKTILGASINAQLAPVLSMLAYEKRRQPEILGSAMFSVGQMYTRLKEFASGHCRTGRLDSALYFVKVDVQSCFDTIPQSRIIRLMHKLVSEDDYQISKHVEVRAPEGHDAKRWHDTKIKPIRKYTGRAHKATETLNLGRVATEELASSKRHTVYVDAGKETMHDSQTLLDLLEEHVQSNIVKIGKKYFQQKRGIPQGSVMSTLLCSMFYGVMEHEYFGFLAGGDGILLRMIDDFLLITPNLEHAARFLQVMIDGIPAYGVSVNAAKSLVNFDIAINGAKVPRMHGSPHFPYCGTFIDTATLEISKMRDRKGSLLSDSLTVDQSKNPGKSFHRKLLKSFKIQAHAMYLDTSYNSRSRVMSNFYQDFIETAMKAHQYVATLPRRKRPSNAFFIGAIRDLFSLASSQVEGRTKTMAATGYACSITKSQIRWLAATAFRQVLRRKQSRYGQVLQWLEETIEVSNRSMGAEAVKLKDLVKGSQKAFEGCQY